MDAPGREVWRTLKKLELLSVALGVTRTFLGSCSPNVLRASEFDDTCINIIMIYLEKTRITKRLSTNY